MKRTALAAAAIVAVLATACSSGGSDKTVTTATSSPSATTAPHGQSPTTTAPAKETSVTIHPLFVQTAASGPASGGVGKEIISTAPSDDKTLRVDFSEDEVAGM